MRINPLPYVVSEDILPYLSDYCLNHGYTNLCLIADENTYQVLGKKVELHLTSVGANVKTIIVTGANIHTDEHYIVQTMVELDTEERCFLAVGSGTITDITRFISHRTHSPFISIPTAPSVDGYTSTVAPMVVGNYKMPVQAQPPVAVFADLPALCSAPQIMIAAGLGDLLGKYTSLADWKIGCLLYDEPYNLTVYSYMKEVVDQTVEIVEQVAAASPQGIKSLMDGLIGSGLGMLEFGDSRPASGSEHHIAHYWEMMSIIAGRPAVLHGVEVGVATILSAKNYESLRLMTKAEATLRLNKATLPERGVTIAEITQAYGPVAEKIIQIQKPFLEMTQSNLDILKSKIIDSWDKIQEIANEVPTASQITEWIQSTGGPVTPAQIGVEESKIYNGLKNAHYLRDRFTLNRLRYWLQ